MKRTSALVCVVVLSGCELLGGGGGGGGGGADAGISPIAFAKGFAYVRKDDRNVYVADEADFQTSGVLTTGGNVFTPSLSKDGKRIVFVRKTAGGGTELAVTPSAGGATSVVLASTAQAKNFRVPVFSPDGAKLAFGFDDGSSPAIGLVGSDGSGFVKLAGGGALSYGLPSWLPDGSALIAAAGSSLGFTQLERIDLVSTQNTSVTNTLGSEAQAIANRLAVSPDGKLAAFDARVGSGVTRVFVIDLSTKVVTKVNEYTAEPGASDSFPSWMGADVAYGSDAGGADNVYSVKVDGTGRKLLVPLAIEAFYGATGP